MRLPFAYLRTFVALVVVSSLAPASPKIEDTVIGPANSGGVYVVSPELARVAFGGSKGTRLVVNVDGVEGPVFDELFNVMGGSYFNPPTVSINVMPPKEQPSTVIPVIFSEDGAYYAYIGRQGNEYVVMHDNKEIYRGPRTMLALNYGNLRLSPGGKHVYWGKCKAGKAHAVPGGW